MGSIYLELGTACSAFAHPSSSPPNSEIQVDLFLAMLCFLLGNQQMTGNEGGETNVPCWMQSGDIVVFV